MPDFIFDKIDKTYTTELNDAYKSVDFKYNKQYSLDEGCLQCLKQNHREGYRKMAHSYIENKPNNHIKPYKNDYIILHDSFVNQNGVILTSDNERYVNPMGTDNPFNPKGLGSNFGLTQHTKNIVI